jgi:hypothetical protein
MDPRDKRDLDEAFLWLDRHVNRMDDLQTQIEQLQEGMTNVRGGKDEESQSTVWTERVNLDSTIKDGYRVKEVTVTVQYPEGERPTREERRKRLMEAIADGQISADRMNHERNQTSRFS